MTEGFLPDRTPSRLRKSSREHSAVAAIVAGVLLLVLGGTKLPQAVRLASGPAAPGTYLVQDSSPSCGRNHRVPCFSRTGEFVSDDGTVTRTGVLLQRIQNPVKYGDRVRAFDVGEPGEVFTYEGNRSWPFGIPVGLGLLGSLALGFGSWRLWRWWRS